MIENLLVPHDLTDLAEAGFDVVRLLGTPVRRVHVVHVLPRIDLQTPTLVWSRDEDEARLAHGREALRTRLLGTDHERATLHVRIGDPGSRIVRLASEIGADLISMASHGRTGMLRYVLGSVSQHVARFAPCPVLVMPATATHRDPPALRGLEPDRSDVTRDEQVDALAVEIARRVAENHGRTLTAVRMSIPHDQEPDTWEPRLTKRLAACGIQFVDLVFAPTPEPRAEVLAATFEEPSA